MSTLDAAIALIVFVSFIEWLAITLKLYQIEEIVKKLSELVESERKERV